MLWGKNSHFPQLSPQSFKTHLLLSQCLHVGNNHSGAASFPSKMTYSSVSSQEYHNRRIINPNSPKHSLEPREDSLFSSIHLLQCQNLLGSLEQGALSTELLQVSLQLRRLIAKALFLLTSYIFTCCHRVCSALLECITKNPEMQEGKNRAGHNMQHKSASKAGTTLHWLLCVSTSSTWLIGQNQVTSERIWGIVSGPLISWVKFI